MCLNQRLVINSIGAHQLSYMFIGTTGGLAILVAGTENERREAMKSLKTLMWLMRYEGLSNDQSAGIVGMLARMQGVRRLSSLLCPLLGPTEDKEMQLGMPTIHGIFVGLTQVNVHH